MHGFYVYRKGGWWIVAPIMKVMHISDMEEFTGEAMELHAFPAHKRNEALDKMYELLEKAGG